MDLNVASEEDLKQWDQLIAESYGGTIFHTMKYLRCLEAHTTTPLLNHRLKGVLYPLVAREGAVIVALFPVFLYASHGVRIVRSGTIGEDLIYLGPVFIEGNLLKPSRLQVRAVRLQKALDGFVKRTLNAHAVHLKISPFYPDARPYLWNGYDVQPLHTYWYYLDLGPEAIWDGFNKGVRKVIANAQKRNLCVEFGGVDEAAFIYDLLDARNRSSSPKALVLDIVQSLSPGNCTVFIAKLDGKMLSGVIVLHYGQYAHLWIGFPGSDTEHSGANELLMWEAIRWAHAQGYNILENTGGDDLTTFQFKRKFNPVLKTYLSVDGSSFVFRLHSCVKRLSRLSTNNLENFGGKDE